MKIAEKLWTLGVISNILYNYNNFRREMDVR